MPRIRHTAHLRLRDLYLSGPPSAGRGSAPSPHPPRAHPGRLVKSLASRIRSLDFGFLRKAPRGLGAPLPLQGRSYLPLRLPAGRRARGHPARGHGRREGKSPAPRIPFPRALLSRAAAHRASAPGIRQPAAHGIRRKPAAAPRSHKRLPLPRARRRGGPGCASVRPGGKEAQRARTPAFRHEEPFL